MTRRDWSATDDVAAAARWCAACGRQAPLQRAHLIGRSRDRRGVASFVVAPDEVVMLCATCHYAYDAHELDLYPLLSASQLRGAMRAAGAPGKALVRLSGPTWRRPDAHRELDDRLHRLEELWNSTGSGASTSRPRP
jgi:hypothetical protein